MTAQPQMSCRELVDLVTEYLEGALDADTHARFEAHLEMCEGCVSYLEQMRSTVRVLGALPEESLMPLSATGCSRFSADGAGHVRDRRHVTHGAARETAVQSLRSMSGRFS